MTLTEIRAMALFQTQNDVDDINEFQPALDAYINEGYEKLTLAYAGKHLGDADDYECLALPSDTPGLPVWMHRAIVDYATYMLFRNGNQIKQNRGMAYYQMYMEVYNKAPYADSTKKRALKNLYVEV